MDASAVGRPGLVVAGRYRLQSLLGRGAMGEVWRARHTTLDTFVAVKLVVSADQSAEATQRLLVEAKAAAAIVSPFVVRIFDHGHEGGASYIAMELLEGETLAARLRRKGRLSPVEAATIIRHVAQGIAQAHVLGIVHRDLKPENVFLAMTEQGDVAKVLDFGIAKSQLTTGMMTQTGVVVGTPAYLSREQVLGTHPVDQRADLWALAIVAYECLTGRLPYRASTMAELFAQICGSTLEAAARDPGLPPAFAAWFARATHTDPDRRFTEARELADELTRALAPDMTLAPWAVSVDARAMRSIPAISGAPRRTSPRLVWGMVAGLGVLASLLVVLALREATRAPEAAASAPATSSSAAARAPAQAPPIASTVVAAATVGPSATEASATPSSAPAASGSGKKPPVRRPVDRWGLGIQ